MMRPHFCLRHALFLLQHPTRLAVYGVYAAASLKDLQQSLLQLLFRC